MSRQIRHIGDHIRQNILPAAMSVTGAAARLGVGRPALSNLLNGRAALSPDMANRLAKAFGADAADLLRRQAEYEREPREDEAKVIAVRGYAPPFLTIKATDIEAWAAKNLDVRQLLPVLLRKLIHSTGRALQVVDFPGYDNAERKGSDGIVEADEATAWIPAGKSIWEFGVSEDPERKANDDYARRIASVPKDQRLETSYVQVTPRNWKKTVAWEAAKAKRGEWKSVRFLEASHLEQWLEESIPAQMWLAEKLQQPRDGFETLEACWDRWSKGSNPPLPKELFAPSIEVHGASFDRWLKERSEKPFVVAADSKDEALAFLACLMEARQRAAKGDASQIKSTAADLALVFESGASLKKLVTTTTAFIPIAASDQAERELATVYRERHCIAVLPRNAVNREPDIALDLLSHDAFEKALASVGFSGLEIDRLARESGYSPTILRRRLSDIETIRTPSWAKDGKSARELIPIAFVGAWHVRSTADREIVEVIAGRKYDDVEADLMQMLSVEDPPVWSAGEYRGVISKTDALFAIAKAVTAPDLKRFLEYAELVLSESDPSLTLPEDKQWMASLYNKVRDHSTALRAGLCETLVFLAVNGNTLFRERLGLDLDAHVSTIIERLLAPLTLDRLQSHERDLPRYAEAAPDTFLSLLERDLASTEPIVFGLLRPVQAGLFGRCLRTGLLWALETLAWSPRTLARVCLILARLSETSIDDNWANKPIASLQAIFRNWMPQTAVSLAERIRILESLVQKFPSIAWQICVAQFSSRMGVGHYSHRPEWRNDASGAGDVVTRGEAHDFARVALKLSLEWPSHDDKTLGDLVECLERLRAPEAEAVWRAIDVWSVTANDDAKARLRERIRRFVLTRRGRHLNVSLTMRETARKVYRALEPTDLVIRHNWLFAKSWVEESADELQGDYDFKSREAWIENQRSEAMRAIWGYRGLEGALALLQRSEAPNVVGYYAAKCVSGSAEAAACVLRMFALSTETSLDGFIEGFLWSLGVERDSVLTTVVAQIDRSQLVRLLCRASFDRNTWRMLEDDEELKRAYWRQVSPWRHPGEDGDLNEVLDRLLEADRPRAAFSIADVDWARVETSRLRRILQDVATKDSEPPGSLVPSAYDVAEALSSLGERPEVTEEEMARLEFLYVRALENEEHHGIPNLEKQIAKQPGLFAQAVALTFKRMDGKEDPPELALSKGREAVAESTYSLLHKIHRIPGASANGNVIDSEALKAWIVEARQLCASYGRAVIGDQMIGQILAHAPTDPDGLWPCRPVCRAMELVASEEMLKGFWVGVHNSRGVVWRRKGGDQEREAAARYENWAQQLSPEFPFVSRALEGIADSYRREAQREDLDDAVTRRLRR